jgi:hypothetical protein
MHRHMFVHVSIQMTSLRLKGQHSYSVCQFHQINTDSIVACIPLTIYSSKEESLDWQGDTCHYGVRVDLMKPTNIGVLALELELVIWIDTCTNIPMHETIL